MKTQLNETGQNFTTLFIMGIASIFNFLSHFDEAKVCKINQIFEFFI